MDIIFKEKKINVEIYGEGLPIVLLNGIMMSASSWKPFVDVLAKDNQLILIDFFDQGKTDKMEEPYTQQLQVELVHHVVQRLDLKKIFLTGISYGGEVGLQFAVKYGDLVEKLILFNTTAFTSPWLLHIGEGWKGASYDPETYYNITIPAIYSPEFYAKNSEWMSDRKKLLVEKIFSNKSFIMAMNRLTDSATSHDVREQLHKITAKTLVVSGEFDYITPIEDQKYINNNIPNCEHVMIPSCGHASMYEKPTIFASLLLGFCNTKDILFKI